MENTVVIERLEDFNSKHIITVDSKDEYDLVKGILLKKFKILYQGGYLEEGCGFFRYDDESEEFSDCCLIGIDDYIVIKGSDFIKANTPELGLIEGEICNRDGCQGVICEYSTDQSCTCFRNPPCGVCTEDRNYCPVCEWEGKER